MNVVLELDQVPIKTKITQILIEQVNEYPCVANCARDDIAQISLMIVCFVKECVYTHC